MPTLIRWFMSWKIVSFFLVPQSVWLTEPLLWTCNGQIFQSNCVVSQVFQPVFRLLSEPGRAGPKPAALRLGLGDTAPAGTVTGHGTSSLSARHLSWLPHPGGKEEEESWARGEKQQSCARAVRAPQRHKLGKERVTWPRPFCPAGKTSLLLYQCRSAPNNSVIQFWLTIQCQENSDSFMWLKHELILSTFSALLLWCIYWIALPATYKISKRWGITPIIMLKMQSSRVGKSLRDSVTCLFANKSNVMQPRSCLSEQLQAPALLILLPEELD